MDYQGLQRFVLVLGEGFLSCGLILRWGREFPVRALRSFHTISFLRLIPLFTLSVLF